jgi:hypothetical protein
MSQDKGSVRTVAYIVPAKIGECFSEDMPLSIALTCLYGFRVVDFPSTSTKQGPFSEHTSKLLKYRLWDKGSTLKD